MPLDNDPDPTSADNDSTLPPRIENSPPSGAVDEFSTIIPGRVDSSIVSNPFDEYATIVPVGIGFFMLPIWVTGFAIIWVAMKAGITASTLGSVLLGVGVLWFVLTALIQSTHETVLLSALYLDATQDEIPRQWEASRLEQAFFASSRRG